VRVNWVKKTKRVQWLGQPLIPLIVLPDDWPAGVPFPARPAYWPDGLHYPPIGNSWAPTAPSWWLDGEKLGNLPKWPPPPPQGWPASFPWPIPPTKVRNSVACEDVCEAQFGTKGTTPNTHGLNGCKTVCKAAEEAKPPDITHTATFRPTTTTPTSTAPSKPSVLPWVIGIGAAAGVVWLIVSG